MSGKPRVGGSSWHRCGSARPGQGRRAGRVAARRQLAPALPGRVRRLVPRWGHRHRPPLSLVGTVAAPTATATILAEYDGRLAGFVHVEFDKDPRWGSLVDNLHVDYRQRRTGIGTQLLARAARAVTDDATGNAMYLWVLEQNTDAQHFYRAVGGSSVGTAAVPPPGGDPTRLNGTPNACAWPGPTPRNWRTP